MRTSEPLVKYIEGAYEDSKLALDLERNSKLDDEALENLSNSLMSASTRMKRELKSRREGA